MSENNDLIEYEMRQHAYDMLAINTVREYEDQVGEWQKFINRVVDAHEDAVKNHQKVLNEMAAEEKAAAELNGMICMLGLSLVTGPLLSWISGTVQYNLVPKLTGSSKTVFVNSTKLPTSPFDDLFPVGQFTEQVHNKVTAKMIGDFAEDRAANIIDGLLSPFSNEKDKIPERAKGSSFQKLTFFSNRLSSTTDQALMSLRTTLEEALIDERRQTVGAITNLATNIKGNMSWGKSTLEKMYKEKPETKKLIRDSLKLEGYKYVEKLVDEARVKWTAWTYYGYNPPDISILEMSRMIEREIWALWILDQDFKQKQYTYISTDDVDHTYNRYVGRSKLPFEHILVDRLVFLNVIDARNTPEREKSMIQKHLMPNEKFTPAKGIDANVDEKKEFAEIEKWAINHPRTNFTRPDNVKNRELGQIVKYR